MVSRDHDFNYFTGGCIHNVHMFRVHRFTIGHINSPDYGNNNIVRFIANLRQNGGQAVMSAKLSKSTTDWPKLVVNHVLGRGQL